MADNTQKVEVEVEADASATVRSARAAAEALTGVVGVVGQLEVKLRQLLQGQVPKELQALVNNLKTAQTLPSNLGNISRTARNLSSGGPQTAFSNAALNSVINTMKTDPSLQLQAIEKQTNKVLEARQEIYKRIRSVMPSDASAMRVNQAYRQALDAIGDMPEKGTAAYNNWLARTRTEVKKFETERTQMATQGAIDRARAEAEIQNKNFDALSRKRIEQEHKDAAVIDRERSRRLKAQTAEAVADERAKWNAIHREANLMNKAYDREARRKTGPDVTRERASRMSEYAMLGIGMGAVLGSFGFAARSTVQMQSALKQLQAITQSTSIEMKSLEKTIYSVGQTSKFSTVEIADGAKTLAQAGYSVSQIAESLPAIANLATGAGANFADAANIVTSVLSVFDKDVTRSAEVSNILAQALNGSKLELGQLSLGLQYAGNIAANGGVQFEELTAALGAMANAGIKSGSTLGTGLRSLIEELENPSQKLKTALTDVGLSMADVDIKSQGLYGVMLNLQQAGFQASGGMEAFDIRSRNAFAAMENNLPAYQQLLNSLAETDAASAAAAIQMDSLAAQGMRLQNALTQAASQGGAPFMAMLQMIAGGAAATVVSLTKFGPLLSIITSLLLSLAISAGGAWLVKLGAGFLSVGGAAGTAAVGVRGFTTALMANPLTWWTLGITVAAQALFGFKEAQQAASAKLEESRAAANSAGAEYQKYQSRIAEVDGYIEMLSARHTALSTNTILAGSAADVAVRKFGSWGLQVDSNITKVDTLIGRLVALRTELAAGAVEQSNKRIAALEEERTGLKAQQSNDKGPNSANALATTLSDTSLLTGGRLGQRQTLDILRTSGALPLLDKFKKGTLSPDENIRLQSILRTNVARLPGTQKAEATALLKKLSGGYSNELAINARALNSERQTNAVATLGALPEATAVGTEALKWLNSYRAAQANVDKIKDPVERSRQAALLRQQQVTNLPKIMAMIGGKADNVLKDPSLLAGIKPLAEAQGISPREFVMNNFAQNNGAIAQLQIGGRGAITSSDPKFLSAQSQNLAAQAALAKKKKDMGSYQALMNQKKAVDERLFLVQNPDLDPLTAQAALEQNGQASDARTAAGMISSGGGRGNTAARQNAKTLGQQVKDLERRITVASGNLGPDAQAMLAGQAALQKLLDEWKKTSEEQIRQEAAGGGASGAELQERLDAFQSDAAKYTAEILNGNLTAAKELLAELADRTASQQAAAIGNQLRYQGGDLATSVRDVQSSINAALAAALDASDAAFTAKGLDPSIAHDAVEARREITQRFAARTVESTLTMIDQWMDAQEAAIANQERGFSVGQARESAGIDALSNSWGSRNLSDAQRYLGDRRREQMSVDAQRNQVGAARSRYDAEVGRRNMLQGQLGSATDPTSREMLAGALGESSARVLELSDNLTTAQLALQAMTEQAPVFTSWAEAASAAWAVFADQANITRPIVSDIADGMVGAFEATRQGLSTLVSDVLTKTTSIKDAFKSLGLSILDSLMSMMTKIIANKILTYGLQLLASAFGGPMVATNGASLGGASGSPLMPAMGSLGTRSYQGGMVRRIQGGPAPPFRDGVSVYAQPGEVMMSKSAVDMIGADNLLRMNAMGNRRMSAMPTVQQAVQRAPDETNVWIVAPERKPTFSKKDVVVALTDDLMTNGESARLVKKIMQGAL